MAWRVNTSRQSAVGSDPTAVGVDPTTNTAYVTNTGSSAVSVITSAISTSMTLASSGSPSAAGAPVTYTATITPVPAGGTVTFTEGPTTDCSAVPVDTSTGQATCTVTYNKVGTQQVAAAYTGDAAYGASSAGPLTQQVAYGVKLLYDPAKANNSGSAVPVKVQLVNAAGTNLSAAATVVTVTGLSPSPAPGKAPTGTFTFTTSNQGPGYQVNVKTTGYPAGTYTLKFTAGADPTTHTVTFMVR